jgi:hypothetical protein
MTMGTGWPRLGAEPHNLKEHVTFLHEACAQLHAVEGSHTAVPTPIIGPIIDSILRLLPKVTRHLDEQSDTRLATQIQGLFKEQRDAQLKEHEAIKAAIQTATSPLKAASPPTGIRIASWAQVAATAGPPPAHVTPPHTILTSSASSTLTVYKGREVIVKLLDHGLAQHFRQLSPTQLKDKEQHPSRRPEDKEHQDCGCAPAEERRCHSHHGFPQRAIGWKDTEIWRFEDRFLKELGIVLNTRARLQPRGDDPRQRDRQQESNEWSRF